MARNRAMLAKLNLSMSNSIGFGGDARLCHRQWVAIPSVCFLGFRPGMGFLSKVWFVDDGRRACQRAAAPGLSICANSRNQRLRTTQGRRCRCRRAVAAYWPCRRRIPRASRVLGPTGIKTVPLGVNPAQVAAAHGRQCARDREFVRRSATCWRRTRWPACSSSLGAREDFHPHVLFATNDRAALTNPPRSVRLFLAVAERH